MTDWHPVALLGVMFGTQLARRVPASAAAAARAGAMARCVVRCFSVVAPGPPAKGAGAPAAAAGGAAAGAATTAAAAAAAPRALPREEDVGGMIACACARGPRDWARGLHVGGGAQFMRALCGAPSMATVRRAVHGALRVHMRTAPLCGAAGLDLEQLAGLRSPVSWVMVLQRMAAQGAIVPVRAAWRAAACRGKGRRAAHHQAAFEHFEKRFDAAALGALDGAPCGSV